MVQKYWNTGDRSTSTYHKSSHRYSWSHTHVNSWYATKYAYFGDMHSQNIPEYAYFWNRHSRADIKYAYLKKMHSQAVAECAYFQNMHSHGFSLCRLSKIVEKSSDCRPLLISPHWKSVAMQFISSGKLVVHALRYLIVESFLYWTQNSWRCWCYGKASFLF